MVVSPKRPIPKPKIFALLYHFRGIYHFSGGSGRLPKNVVQFSLMDRETERMVAEARAAAEYACGVRELHRRRSKKNNSERQEDIRVALERIQAAMKPIHAKRISDSYRRQTATAQQNREPLRSASQAMQRERRKLWKMM